MWELDYKESFSSVQFSCSVVSDSLRPHELQHARPPCPSPTPGVHSNSCPSSRWCHPAISSSGIPFSSCPKSLPASESFPMSQLFTWDGQSMPFICWRQTHYFSIDRSGPTSGSPSLLQTAWWLTSCWGEGGGQGVFFQLSFPWLTNRNIFSRL